MTRSISKQEIYDALRARLGLPPESLGIGSKEYKGTLESIRDVFQLGDRKGETKQSLAARIAREAGIDWLPAYQAPGQTITSQGLQCLLAAIDVLASSRAPETRRYPVGSTSIGLGAPFQSSIGGVTEEKGQQWRCVNLDALDRSTRLHAEIQAELAEAVRKIGHEPRRPQLGKEPEFDLAWRGKQSIWVAEVKSMHEGNATQQARLGLGQVLEYAAALVELYVEPVVPVLASNRQPPDPCRRACERANVLVAWTGRFEEQLRKHIRGTELARGARQ